MNTRTKPINTVLTALIATIALLGNITAPAQAQAPKPPTDARKVVQPAKAGKLIFGSDDAAFERAATQVRDFDVLFSTTNPDLRFFIVGVDFRAVTFSRFYSLLVGSDGDYGLFISREFGKFEPVKPIGFTAALKKNLGERNDFALYVRGNSAQFFLNKQFVDSWDVGEINDFGELNLYAAGSKDQGGEIAYKGFTVKVPNNALPPTANGPTNNNIVVSLYRSGYSQWGRPAGMDDPRQGCQGFDDSRPVWQFQAVLKVTNNTKYPMKRWLPLAIKRDGKIAYGCALAYDRAPVIEPGQSIDITFEYYIEKNDAIASVLVFDLEQGRSNRLPTAAP
jgi:hypothetical protein